MNQEPLRVVTISLDARSSKSKQFVDVRIFNINEHRLTGYILTPIVIDAGFKQGDTIQFKQTDIID